MITAVTVRPAQGSGLVCLTPLRARHRATHPNGCSANCGPGCHFELEGQCCTGESTQPPHTHLKWRPISVFALTLGAQRCTKRSPRTTALDSVPYPTHGALWIQPPKQLSPPPSNHLSGTRSDGHPPAPFIPVSAAKSRPRLQAPTRPLHPGSPLALVTFLGCSALSL